MCQRLRNLNKVLSTSQNSAIHEKQKQTHLANTSSNIQAKRRPCSVAGKIHNVTEAATTHKQQTSCAWVMVQESPGVKRPFRSHSRRHNIRNWIYVSKMKCMMVPHGCLSQRLLVGEKGGRWWLLKRKPRAVVTSDSYNYGAHLSGVLTTVEADGACGLISVLRWEGVVLTAGHSWCVKSQTILRDVKLCIHQVVLSYEASVLFTLVTVSVF